MKYDISAGVSRSAGRVFSAFRSALFSMLQRQSFESISVQSLCNAADYPRSTFYNYFDDIYDLLDYCLQTPIRSFHMEDYEDLAPEMRVYAIFSDLFDLLQSQREAVGHVFKLNRPNGVLVNSLNRRLKQEVFLALADAAPEGRKDIPREMLAEHCCSVISLLFDWCFLRKEPLSKEKALAAMRALVGGLYRDGEPTGGAAS